MSVDGTWQITLKTPLGERAETVVLKSDGSKLAERDRQIYDGSVTGNEAAWKTDITSPMPMTLEFKAKVDGNKISGTATTSFGQWSFEGDRA